MNREVEKTLAFDRISTKEPAIAGLVADIGAAVHGEQHIAQPASGSKNRLGDYHASLGSQHSGHFAETIHSQFVIHVMHNANEHGQVERIILEWHAARIDGLELSVCRPAGCRFYIARLNIYADIVVHSHIYDGSCACTS